MMRFLVLLGCVFASGAWGQEAAAPVAAEAVPEAAAAPAPSATPAPERTIYNDSSYTKITGTAVALVVPEGFRPVGDGKTFRHATLPGIIEVSKLPAAYAEVIKVFTAEEMSGRGLRLVSKDNVTVGDRPALLLRVAENTAQTTFHRWTLVVGDYQETYMVSGTFAAEVEGELSAVLRGAVMSTRWGKREKVDPFANFRFAVEPTPKLTYAEDKSLSTLVVFTKDGVFPLNGPGDPLLLVGYELNEEKITDEQAFAKEALMKVPHCKEVKPLEKTLFQVAGLPTVEWTADAKDESSGTPVKIFQSLVFAEGYHIFLLGIVDVARWEEYLGEFKTMSRTLRLKD